MREPIVTAEMAEVRAAILRPFLLDFSFALA